MGEPLPYLLYSFDPIFLFLTFHIGLLLAPFSAHTTHIPLMTPVFLLVSYCRILGLCIGIGVRQLSPSMSLAGLAVRFVALRKWGSVLPGLAGLIWPMAIQRLWHQGHSFHHRTGAGNLKLQGEPGRGY